MMNVLILYILICVTYAKQEPLTDDLNVVTMPNESKLLYTKTYNPDWDDLDTRPLPQWYDSAKIGIFLHWGVYSVPSFKSEWFWADWKSGNDEAINDFMKKSYPGFTYQEFAPMFTAEFFDPKEWAKLFAQSGAKYVVLTSKHHEGYTLFPSKRSFSWNSVDVGPKLDIVKHLSEAVKEAGLKFGVYHSLYEWFNPIYLEDSNANFTTTNYTDNKLWPDIKQIINDYKPSLFWADGDWEANDTYWKSPELLAWFYNESPVKDEIVVNDRWGRGIGCHHGDFFNCKDRYNPGVLMNHKWENAFTIDKKSWGFRRNMKLSEILTINELLQTVVSTVSCGGNALIDVGPTKDGIIVPIFQERLLQLGEWLTVNGEAIYDTSPWSYQNDSLNTDVWYTCRKKEYNPSKPVALPSESDIITAVYAIFLKWPNSNLLSVKDLAPYLHKGIFQVDMLGSKGFENLNWRIAKGVVEITLPDKADVTTKHAWTLKIRTKL
ncbi:alpha-L-fucosidase-like [Hyposmocoma kahamanoa]|uniref:alpha-L-fucosidase-like n=1 Tax=Hyposmocoma kahamanoa TaxID=1477025 RepID=UPI000E6D6241|nr:alpha-L-fucosidase-like [Hyposmocoma kahamanoa]